MCNTEKKKVSFFIDDNSYKLGNYGQTKMRMKEKKHKTTHIQSIFIANNETNKGTSDSIANILTPISTVCGEKVFNWKVSTKNVERTWVAYRQLLFDVERVHKCDDFKKMETK